MAQSTVAALTREPKPDTYRDKHTRYIVPNAAYDDPCNERAFRKNSGYLDMGHE